MNKKYAALFTASALLLTSLSAAENFPTSQFDHDGWSVSYTHLTLPTSDLV